MRLCTNKWIGNEQMDERTSIHIIASLILSGDLGNPSILGSRQVPVGYPRIMWTTRTSTVVSTFSLKKNLMVRVVLLDKLSIISILSLCSLEDRYCLFSFPTLRTTLMSPCYSLRIVSLTFQQVLGEGETGLSSRRVPGARFGMTERSLASGTFGQGSSASSRWVAWA